MVLNCCCSHLAGVVVEEVQAAEDRLRIMERRRRESRNLDCRSMTLGAIFGYKRYCDIFDGLSRINRVPVNSERVCSSLAASGTFSRAGSTNCRTCRYFDLAAEPMQTCVLDESRGRAVDATAPTLPRERTEASNLRVSRTGTHCGRVGWIGRLASIGPVRCGCRSRVYGFAVRLLCECVDE